jgi:two-component system, OmpR family, response regulator
MDGYEVAERIRATLGTATHHDKRRARQAGFDLHMTKPLDPEALLQALRRLASSASSS